MGGQTFKEGLAGGLGVIHGWLVALQEQKEPELIPVWHQQQSEEWDPGAHRGTGVHRDQHPQRDPAAACARLTNIFRCRAQTSPSPPLFPGPQTTSTAGWLVVKELGG